MSDRLGEDKNAGEFVPVGDPAELTALIAEAFRTEAQAIFWTSDQQILLRATMHRLADDQATFAVQLQGGVNARGVAAKLSVLSVPDCHFSVSLSKANILFRSTYRGAELAELHFDRPKKIFKVQRRKDLRVDILDGYLLKIEFSHPRDSIQRFVRKCQDISAGGLSFLIEPAEAVHFTSGIVLTQVSFTLNGRRIRVNGEVRHCKALRGKTNWYKVGIQFRDLRASDAQHVAKYVFDENVKRMSRYL